MAKETESDFREVYVKLENHDQRIIHNEGELDRLANLPWKISIAAGIICGIVVKIFDMLRMVIE